MMLGITNKVKIPLDKPLSRVVIPVKQNDKNSRRISFTLTQNGTVYDIENVRMAAVRGTKPDGKQIYNDCLIIDNEIIYDITSQTISAEGRVTCELVLFGSDLSEIASAAFVIEVYPYMFDDTVFESSNEYKILGYCIEECTAAAARAEKADGSATASADRAEEAALSVEGAIGNITKQISTISSNIDELSEEFAELTDDVFANSNAISELNDNVSTLSQNKAEQREVDELKNNIISDYATKESVKRIEDNIDCMVIPDTTLGYHRYDDVMYVDDSSVPFPYHYIEPSEVDKVGYTSFKLLLKPGKSYNFKVYIDKADMDTFTAHFNRAELHPKASSEPKSVELIKKIGKNYSDSCYVYDDYITFYCNLTNCDYYGLLYMSCKTDRLADSYAYYGVSTAYNDDGVGIPYALSQIGKMLWHTTFELENLENKKLSREDLQGYALKSDIPTEPSEVGAEPSGTTATHNTNADSHNDIRLLIQGLTDRLDALADCDDETLDQLSEIVAYIKDNRELIDAVTTSKVSVDDIVDNLTTNVNNRPLSAAQGVALKSLIDAIIVPKKVSDLEDGADYVTESKVNEIVENKANIEHEHEIAAGRIGLKIGNTIIDESQLQAIISNVSVTVKYFYTFTTDDSEKDMKDMYSYIAGNENIDIMMDEYDIGIQLAFIGWDFTFMKDGEINTEISKKYLLQNSIEDEPQNVVDGEYENLESLENALKTVMYGIISDKENRNSEINLIPLCIKKQKPMSTFKVINGVITKFNDEIFDAGNIDEVTFRERPTIYITANKAPENQKFAYWKIEDKIYSFNETEMARPYVTTTVIAEYVDVDEEINAIGKTRMVNFLMGSETKLKNRYTLTTESIVPNGCTITKTGQYIWRYTVEPENDNWKNEPPALIKGLSSSSTNYMYLYTFSVSKTLTYYIYIRAYVTYTDKDGNEDTQYDDNYYKITIIPGINDLNVEKL